MIRSIAVRRFHNFLPSATTRRAILAGVFLVILLLGISRLAPVMKLALAQPAKAGSQAETLTGGRAVAWLKQNGLFNPPQNTSADTQSPESSLPQAILLANDGTTDDNFGVSMALSGNTVVVGAWFADIGGNTNQGAAYVFVRNGGAWTLQQKLTVNDGMANDGFGASVAISGDTIVVASPSGDSPPLSNTGAAYVFVRNGTTWAQQQRLIPSPISTEGFGLSVAISGDSIVVGATDTSGSNSSPGSAYVFVRNGTTWSQQQHLVVPGVTVSAHIGRSVSIDGDTVLLGAPDDLTGNGFTGSAYVFTRTGTTWALQQQLLASDSLNNALFGVSVDISGDTAVIGAVGRGAAYVFVRSGTTWTQQQKLKAIDSVASDGFGYSVAINGESLVVGTPFGVFPASVGSAYLFTRTGTLWTQQMKFLPIAGQKDNGFGQSVDIDDAAVVAGVPSDDVGAIVNRGSAYVFSRSCSYSISPTTQNVPAAGGTGSISITAGAGCSWRAVSDASWVSLSATGGTGNGTINFLATQNLGAARTGTIIVAGQVFRVMQDPGCVFTVLPGAQVFSESGGSGSVTVSTNGLCPWTAISNDAWITIPSGGSGNGFGIFSYSVAAFAGGTRTGTISAAGQTVTIIQTSGCEYAISPTSQNIDAFGSPAVNLFTLPSCSWTVVSNAPWLSIQSAASGVGNASISISAAQNSSPTPRTGTVTIAGKTFTVNQAGNCSFAVTPPTTSFGTDGGNGTASVSTPSDCSWTAQSKVAWITITSGASGTGNGTVNFTVEANMGAARTGQLTIAGQTFFVTQTGKLVYYPLPYPVRLHDSRQGFSSCTGSLGGPIQGGTSRSLPAKGVTCNGLTIPGNAMAVTGNITTVQSGGGYLTLYPDGTQQPLVANSNYLPNEVVNNVFTVGLSTESNDFRVFASSTTDVVVDVTGYYAPLGVSGLYFHPLPKPVRLLETRAGFTGCFAPGAPLPGGVDTPQQARISCDGVTIPDAALAIVGNATTVGPSGPGYLTLFPASASRPLVASSNYATNQIVNGPFTTGLSPSGEFKIFTLATTDLVVDVLGYYSPDAMDTNGAGLLFSPLPRPVRLLETRAGFSGCFAPGSPITGGADFTQQARGLCNGEIVPISALAVVGNATVVNSNGGYLTLWPSNVARPLVATSNFNVGQVFNRHFTVGLGPDGAFNIYSQFTTDLVVDLAGSFVP